MPKEIYINHKGKVLTAIVDDEDYPLLSRHTWYIRSTTYPNKPYPSTNLPLKNGKLRLLPMHYFIMGTGNVDHWNQDTLDNQKHNLRPSTHQENGWNTRKLVRTGNPCSSQFKGVSYSPYKGRDRWIVLIKHVERGQHKSTGKVIRVGYFWDEIEAAKAYNKKIVELRGEWAWLNPIPTEASDAA
jgi:hypothetical protein